MKRTDPRGVAPNLRLNPFAQPLARARLALLPVALAPLLSLANPAGGMVTAGQATISAIPSLTTIQQHSASAVIDWQQFGIAQGESVHFMQPSASAAVLNRVIGGNPSEILGNLSANGRVFLVNPQGVMFGQGSRLDVGGLVASTLDISNEDFQSGRYVFTGEQTPGAVTNEGMLTARDGGFIVLAGGNVRNGGLIQTRLGNLVLASGSGLTLDINDTGLVSYHIDTAALADAAGVSNTGELLADGGRVFMSAQLAQGLAATAVNNTGLVRATRISEQNGVIVLEGRGGNTINSGTLDASSADVAGGTVNVLGDADVLINGGTIDASGATGGGVIRIGGGWQGGEGLVAAQRTYVAPDAMVHADATEQGQGGSIAVWSEAHTVTSGLLSARGAGTGQGGAVETSAQGYLVVSNAPDIRGGLLGGRGGSWLIDPNNLDIVNDQFSNIAPPPQPVGNTPAQPFVFSASQPNSILHVDSVLSALSTAGTVTITTGSTGEQDGNIRLLADLDYGNISGNGTLILMAANNIEIQQSVRNGTGSQQSLNLSLIADGDIAIRSSIDTNGGDLTVTAGSARDVASLDDSSPNIGIYADLITHGGELSLSAGSGAGRGEIAFGTQFSTPLQINAGNGDISLISDSGIATDFGSVEFRGSNFFAAGDEIDGPMGAFNFSEASITASGNITLLAEEQALKIGNLTAGTGNVAGIITLQSDQIVIGSSDHSATITNQGTGNQTFIDSHTGSGSLRLAMASGNCAGNECINGGKFIGEDLLIGTKTLGLETGSFAVFDDITLGSDLQVTGSIVMQGSATGNISTQDLRVGSHKTLLISGGNVQLSAISAGADGTDAFDRLVLNAAGILSSSSFVPSDNIASTTLRADQIIALSSGGTLTLGSESQSLSLQVDGTSTNSILFLSAVDGLTVNGALTATGSAIDLDSGAGITITGNINGDSLFIGQGQFLRPDDVNLQQVTLTDALVLSANGDVMAGDITARTISIGNLNIEFDELAEGRSTEDLQPASITLGSLTTSAFGGSISEAYIELLADGDIEVSGSISTTAQAGELRQTSPAVGFEVTDECSGTCGELPYTYADAGIDLHSRYGSVTVSGNIATNATAGSASVLAPGAVDAYAAVSISNGSSAEQSVALSVGSITTSASAFGPADGEVHSTAFVSLKTDSNASLENGAFDDQGRLLGNGGSITVEGDISTSAGGNGSREADFLSESYGGDLNVSGLLSIGGDILIRARRSIFEIEQTGSVNLGGAVSAESGEDNFDIDIESAGDINLPSNTITGSRVDLQAGGDIRANNFADGLHLVSTVDNLGVQAYGGSVIAGTITLDSAGHLITGGVLDTRTRDTSGELTGNTFGSVSLTMGLGTVNLSGADGESALTATVIQTGAIDNEEFYYSTQVIAGSLSVAAPSFSINTLAEIDGDLSLISTAGNIEIDFVPTGNVSTEPSIGIEVTGDLDLRASNGSILLDNASIVGDSVYLAGNVIGSTGAVTISGDAVSMQAATISLASSNIVIGTGAALMGTDYGLIEALSNTAAAEAGILPNSSIPNGFFDATESLTLGSITGNAEYIVLHAPTLTANSASSITSMSDLFLHYAPADNENFAFELSQLGFANDVATLAIGRDDYSGDIIIGNSPPVFATPKALTPNGNDTNYLFVTTGDVTGLENLITTGLKLPEPDEPHGPMPPDEQTTLVTSQYEAVDDENINADDEEDGELAILVRKDDSAALPQQCEAL